MNSRRIPPWLWTLAALLLGLTLRLWFIVHIARVAGDTLIYGEIAKNWMQHNVYGFIQKAGVPQPTLIRLPGYPLFLMVCFRLFGTDNYTAVMIVQAVIDLLSCLLISDLAGRLFDSPRSDIGPGSIRARQAALWLACLCPFTASYTATPLTETLTLACITLALYALYRWQQAGPTFNRWLWILAATLAYAILLRPEQGLLAAAILPAMLWIALRTRAQTRNPQPTPNPVILSKAKDPCISPDQAHPYLAVPPLKRVPSLPRAILPVLTAALLTLLPLVPWTIRNQHTFHVFQPLAPRYATDPGETVPLDFQRWYRTWAIEFASTEDVYWNYDGAEIPLADLPDRAFDIPSAPGQTSEYARTAALLDDYNQTSNDTPALEARWAALAAERIHAAPLRFYLGLPFARLANMLLRPRVEMFPTPLEWWKWRENLPQAVFAASYALLNLVYLALATCGLTLWRSRKRTTDLAWPDRIGASQAPLAWAMLATLLLRSALLLTLDNSEPRYTLEFFPIIFLLAAVPFTRSSSP